MNKSEPISQLIRYSAVGMPIAFVGLPLYIHAPDFYATHTGLSLGLMGIILLGLRMVDAIQDPIIGMLSDKYHSKRPVVMVVASIFLVLGFVMLFVPPQHYTPLWFAGCMFVTTTCFSILTINLHSTGATAAKTYHDKTLFASWREAFAIVGLLLAVVLPTVLSQAMPLQEAFLLIGAIIALLFIPSLLLHVRWFLKQDFHFQQLIQKAFQLPPMSPRTKGLYALYGLVMVSSSLSAVVVLFYIRQKIDAEDLAGLFLGFYFLSAIAGMALWHRVSKRASKEKAWLMAMIIGVLSFMWATFLGPNDLYVYGIICVISGIAFGADLVMPHSILADHIAEKQQQALATTYYGLLAFIAKLAFALASVMAFGVLDAVGFSANGQNTSTAIITLGVVYAGVPCLLKLIASAVLWFQMKRYTTGEIYEKSLSTTTIRSHHHV